MAGKVESFLKSELEKKNALLFVLIDSEVSNLEASSKLAQDVEKIGASAILVGGSSATDQIEMSQVVKGIKQNIQIQIILFPGNVTGVVPDADAILFSSLMLVVKHKLMINLYMLRLLIILLLNYLLTKH